MSTRILSNVISLFDGISCGQEALLRAGFAYRNYYASEIDKKAIAVTQERHPFTYQVGDVRHFRPIRCLIDVDLIMGGSPCQGFSFSGKVLNFDDPRSRLFFEFERIVKHLEPRYFLLENVVMSQRHQDVISERLGVEPIKINSNRFVPQNRERLYWTNIPVNLDELPKTRPRSVIAHVLENNRAWKPAAIRGRKINTLGKVEPKNPDLPYVQCIEVRQDQANLNCLTGVDKDSVITAFPHGRIAYAFEPNVKNFWRYLTVTEYLRLQGLPDHYMDGVELSETKAKKLIGNGWTVDVISFILRGMNGSN